MVPFTMTGNQIPKGALDFSYLLDAPAGKHGFLKSVDGKFTFEDGTKIKFFGVNLVFGAAFPTKTEAVYIADRLAKSGMNMVRYHHVDSMNKDSSLIDYSDGKSQTISENNIDRFDFLSAELKKRGIYIHIDTHTLRKFTKEDGLDFEDDLPGGVKTITLFNKRIIELHRDYMKKYLTHKNPYTGLRYLDDPCVAVVQMINENSSFWFNDKELPPSYANEYKQLWNKFLIKKYKTRETLKEAWTNIEGMCALFDNECPEDGTVAGPLIGGWGELRMPWNTQYDSLYSPARNADSHEFLTEVEVGYYEETKDFLRNLGVKCVIDLSNLPANIAELYCKAKADVVEQNCYWNHPMGGFAPPVKFHDFEMTKLDPRRHGHNMGFAGNMISRFATAKVSGKPVMVTEWNVCHPTKFRADMMIFLAAYGAYQDWDGFLLFSYSHASGVDSLTRGRIAGFFDSYTDPAVWGMAGVASALFQGGLVDKYKNLIEIAYTPEDRYASSPFNDVFMESLPFMTGVSTTFIDNSKYEGGADAVVTGPNTATGDYTASKRKIAFTVSPYTDGFQKKYGLKEFADKHKTSGDAEEIKDKSGNVVGYVDDKTCYVTKPGYYFSSYDSMSVLVDKCLKKWKLIDENVGYKEPGRFITDNGKIDYNFTDGYLSVLGENYISLSGYINGKRELGDFYFDTQNQKAAISLVSKDNKPICQSEIILIAAVGECCNSDMVWEGSTLIDAGKDPTLIDPIKTKIFIPSCKNTCEAYAINQYGDKCQKLPVEKTEGGYIINTDINYTTIYFEVCQGD